MDFTDYSRKLMPEYRGRHDHLGMVAAPENFEMKVGVPAPLITSSPLWTDVWADAIAARHQKINIMFLCFKEPPSVIKSEK